MQWYKEQVEIIMGKADIPAVSIESVVTHVEGEDTDITYQQPKLPISALW